MDLLKRNYWWVWLLLFLGGNSIIVFILGAFLKVYNKDAWYAKPRNWVLGLLLFVFPVFIMLTVFIVQITVSVAKKLEVPGSDLYTSPYIWILLIVIPIIGWIGLSLLTVYLSIAIIVRLAQGKGEQYIE